jgi:NAD(P)-dependent dehydrogenase (short-subunit alcohol dehydrogenase family)
MRDRSGGAIVNTASTAGLRGGRAQIAAYNASKWAVVGLPRTAALELAAHGIRVNAVCPAPTETRMMRALERGLNPADPESVRASGGREPAGALRAARGGRGAGGLPVRVRRRVHYWRRLPYRRGAHSVSR